MKKKVIIFIALAVVIGIAIYWAMSKHEPTTPSEALPEEALPEEVATSLTVLSIEPTTMPDVRAYAYANELQEVLQDKAETCLWASLSPNGEKICYYVSGEGCIVCEANGENAQLIARDCRAAKWLNDNVIVGMEDKDDGEALLSSVIVAYDVNSKEKTTLTPDTMIAIDPVIVENGVVCTVGDEYYLIKLK